MRAGTCATCSGRQVGRTVSVEILSKSWWESPYEMAVTGAGSSADIRQLQTRIFFLKFKQMLFCSYVVSLLTLHHSVMCKHTAYCEQQSCVCIANLFEFSLVWEITSKSGWTAGLLECSYCLRNDFRYPVGIITESYNFGKISLGYNCINFLPVYLVASVENVCYQHTSMSKFLYISSIKVILLMKCPSISLRFKLLSASKVENICIREVLLEAIVTCWVRADVALSLKLVFWPGLGLNLDVVQLQITNNDGQHNGLWLFLVNPTKMAACHVHQLLPSEPSRSTRFYLWGGHYKSEQVREVLGYQLIQKMSTC